MVFSHISVKYIFFMHQIKYMCNSGVVRYISYFFVCSDRMLTFGIRSIRSPAKVGGYYKAVNYQPDS